MTPFAPLTNRVSRLGGSTHRTPFAPLTNRVSRLGLETSHLRKGMQHDQ